MLCFSNDFDFTGKVDNDCLEKLVGVKRMLVTEFEDYNVAKLIYPLSIVDGIKIIKLSNNLDSRLVGTDSLKGMHFSFSQF